MAHNANVYYVSMLSACAGRCLSKELSGCDFFPETATAAMADAVLVRVVRAVGKSLRGGKGLVTPQELLDAVAEHDKGTPFCPSLTAAIRQVIDQASVGTV